MWNLSLVHACEASARASATPPDHMREIVKAQAQEKGKNSFFLFMRLFLRLRHTCEPGFIKRCQWYSTALRVKMVVKLCNKMFFISFKCCMAQNIYHKSIYTLCQKYIIISGQRKIERTKSGLSAVGKLCENLYSHVISRIRISFSLL